MRIKCARSTVTLLSLVGITHVAACAGCRESPGSSLTTATHDAEKDATRAQCYWTWPPLEFDRCAAAWLIGRFIAPEATVEIRPRGTHDDDGTPFDVPNAQWMRTAHASCTERVLADRGLDDPALHAIAQHARRIELGRWMLDEHPDSRYHFEQVQTIIDATPDPDECLRRTNAYFDELYERLSARVAIEAASTEAQSSEASSDGP